MATPVKISELPLLSTAPSINVEFPINDAGTTKKLTLDNLLTRVGSLSSLSAGITNTSIVNAINSIYALDASLSQKGFVNTTGQAFAGDKTFAGSIILDGNQASFKSNGANYAVLKARTSMSGSYILYLPESLPGTTQFLTLNSSGQLATTVAGVLTSITAGAGLTGGTITTSGTITLANSGVTAATYGTSTSIPVFTVDAYGRLTSVTNTAIPAASSTLSGLVSITTQQFIGTKEFLNDPKLTLRNNKDVLFINNTDKRITSNPFFFEYDQNFDFLKVGNVAQTKIATDAGVVLSKNYSTLITNQIAPTVFTLPDSGTGEEYKGWVFTIKDGMGTASTNTITITATGGKRLDGSAGGSYIINTNRGCVSIMGVASPSNVLEWHIINKF